MPFVLLLFAVLLRPAYTAPAVAAEPALPLACLERNTFTTGTYLDEPLRIDGVGPVLAARLYLPNRPAPHPAVVVLPGGGQSPKKYYTARFIAARLARCGVAALFYYKRGTGLSEGDWGRATLDDLIADAERAVAALQQHPAVDTLRVGLVGISQGGQLAPVVAARAQGVGFIVSASGPFASIRETRLHAVAQYARRNGYDARQEAALIQIWEDFLALAAAQASTESLTPRIARLSRQVPIQALPPNRPGWGPVFNSLQADFSPDLRRLHIPMLALYGAFDEIVPVATSVARLRALLSPDVPLDLLIVPEVNHGFRYAQAGQPRYRFEEVIVAWVLTRVGLLDECRRAPPLATRSATPDPTLEANAHAATDDLATDGCALGGAVTIGRP